MYVRVTTAQIDPSKLDDAARVWRTVVLPDHRRYRGFRRAVLLADRATGTVMIASYWDTQADADSQARDRTRAALTAQVRVYFDTSANVRGYELLAEGPAP